MTVVSITELRRRLPELLGRVEDGGEVRVTRRGKLVARIQPAEDARTEAQATLARLRERAVIGDVESPIDADWEAHRAGP